MQSQSFHPWLRKRAGRLRSVIRRKFIGTLRQIGMPACTSFPSLDLFGTAAADESALFMTAWYLDQYPDVAASGQNPFRHYMLIGFGEGRDPNPLFSTRWYLQQYPDVARAGLNPLAHYMARGAAEGRDPNPLFSSSWYLQRYPDVAASGENPLAHFLKSGASEGRDPHPLFSTKWYLARYPEALRSGQNPLVDYLERLRLWFASQRQQASEASADAVTSYFLPQGEDKRPDTKLVSSREKTAALPQAAPRETGILTHGTARAEADWKFLERTLENAHAAAPVVATTLNTSTSLSERGAVGMRQVAEVSQSGQPLNIVFVSYGPYDNNSAIHITGFANALSGLGHRVAFSASGSQKAAGDLGLPRFKCIPHEDISENPELLDGYFSGHGSAKPDLVHCWTPRDPVRQVAQLLVDRYRCPYLVHFEDNEVAVIGSYPGNSLAEAPLFPSDPSAENAGGASEFVGRAAGATVIVEALKEILPKHLPLHLLEPGVDPVHFAPGLNAGERETLCDVLDVPREAYVAVYSGNVHSANAEDVLSLYVAVHALNASGFRVHLIRTGLDSVAHPMFAELSRRHVTSLGFVRREWLVEILKLADLFVQPGGPSDFNRYRLPSKIPEFLAMERPVILPHTNIGLKLENRLNALLMERGDAEDIASRVMELLTNHALRARLAREARHFALEHFNWNRSAEKLVQFYTTIVRRSALN